MLQMLIATSDCKADLFVLIVDVTLLQCASILPLLKAGMCLPAAATAAPLHMIYENV